MPVLLESGKLRLSLEEARSYRAAADHLHEACEMGLDLTRPVTADELLLLRLTHAALDGNVGVLDRAVAKVEAAIQARKHHN